MTTEAGPTQALDPMSSSNPEDNLTLAEIEDLDRCEAIAQHGLDSYVQVGNALAEIRDRHLYRGTHPSFESYVSARWGVNIPNGHLPSQSTLPPDAPAAAAASQALTKVHNNPCEVLAKACEETLSALADDERMVIDVRLAVRKPGDPEGPADGRSLESSGVAKRVDHDLLPALRWLLTQASGTIAEVAHQLESRATDIDDRARAYLRDDVLDVDDELATVKALLVRLIDWDSELERLLKDEIPPLESDSDPPDHE